MGLWQQFYIEEHFYKTIQFTGLRKTRIRWRAKRLISLCVRDIHGDI